MATEDDGVNEALGGVGRVAVTAAGTVLEGAARRREAEARERAAEERAAAAGDRARARATEEVTALAVLHADDVLTAAGTEVGRLEPEVAEARDVAGRNQARPPVEAVATAAAAPKARSPRARGRGRAPERGRDR